MHVSFDLLAGGAVALRRAAAVHARHEDQIGHADLDRPDWYARYMEQQQAGRPGLARPGAGI